MRQLRFQIRISRYIIQSKLHLKDFHKYDYIPICSSEFVCPSGQSASPKTCAEKKLLRIANSKIGYLTSDFTLSTELGSSRCPWQIVALPGQRINITLFNLRTASTETTNSSTSGSSYSLTGTRTKRCPNVLAIVRESTIGGATVEEIVCASGLRESTAYLSQGNSLTVVMSPTKGSVVHSNIKYIVKYEGKIHTTFSLYL